MQDLDPTSPRRKPKVVFERHRGASLRRSLGWLLGLASGLLGELRIAEAQEPHWAESAGDVPDPPDSLEVLDSLKIEGAIMLGAITYGGAKAWGWGTHSFHVTSEGWWGMDTHYAGLDKCGHFFNTYALGELFYFRLREYNNGQRVVTAIPAFFGFSLMAYVEVADGFSTTHGFSPEDFIMDFGGASLSALRNAVPQVGDILDVRFEYMPSRTVKGAHPFKDYSGQKFLGVIKPAGIPVLRETPLRYFEFLTGYSARGFKWADRDHYSRRTTELFVGVGLNLEQLFLKRLEWQWGKPIDYLTTLTQHFQVPYTYLPYTVRERHAPHPPPGTLY